MDRHFVEDRVRGSLAAACVGDALGAPTEQRGIEEIRDLWGGRVETFHAPPGDSPYSKGRRAAQITDDASQTLHLVDAYLKTGGELTIPSVVSALLEWSENSQYYPRFAGPTTRVAIERLRAGDDPLEVGRAGRIATEGSSNGCAMRVAPAGLMHPGDPDAAIRDALITCQPTHATNLAVAGAACVAAATAVAASSDSNLLDVTRAARRGAVEGEKLGRKYGRAVAGPSVPKRLDAALAIAASTAGLDEAVEDIAALVGSGLHVSEAVPAALGIFLAAQGDPFLTVVGGANVGDDTDTVACIAGGIAGAFSGFDCVPQEMYSEVLCANDFDIQGRSDRFVSLVVEKVCSV